MGGSPPHPDLLRLGMWHDFFIITLHGHSSNVMTIYSECVHLLWFFDVPQLFPNLLWLLLRLEENPNPSSRFVALSKVSCDVSLLIGFHGASCYCHSFFQCGVDVLLCTGCMKWMGCLGEVCVKLCAMCVVE